MAKDYRTAKRKAVRRTVERILKSGKPTTMAAIAKMLDMSDATVRYHVHALGLREKLAALEPQPTIRELALQASGRREAADYRALYRKAVEDNASLQRQISGLARARDFAGLIRPTDFHVEKSSGGRAATAMALCGDCHFDERIDADATNGINEYNSDIATRRVQHLFPAFVNLLDMCRKKSTITRMVLVLLGDFITSWIHDDLIQDARYTPPEAVMIALNHLAGGIDHLLDAGDLKELCVVAVCGNHGRITAKRPVKKSPQKSYEWLLYNILAMRYANRKPSSRTKISFQMPQGYFNWVHLYGRDIRIHHGDAIRYQGGTGGIVVPAYRAIADWNTAKHADLDIFGHHHMGQQPFGMIVNGSLIGYSELAIHLHCKHQRPQQFFYIEHERFGPTAQFPIIVD